jgi:hypothetical protein
MRALPGVRKRLSNAKVQAFYFCRLLLTETLVAASVVVARPRTAWAIQQWQRHNKIKSNLQVSAVY